MRKSNVAFRLRESLLSEARSVAATEGVALNQFINVAVAEKLSALRTEDYFRERAERGNVAKARRIVDRAGKGKAPVPGDELESSPEYGRSPSTAGSRAHFARLTSAASTRKPELAGFHFFGGSSRFENGQQGLN